MTKSAGFTLIELSIVLVIIGLIVGGVLVGNDLIAAARVRATVGQYEKYTSAIHTFQTKYNGLPGDLLNAANFGFTAATAGNGVVPGDGLLEASNGGSDVSFTNAGYETTLFWEYLSAANLIDVQLTAAGPGPAANLTGAVVPNYFPAVKLGRGNYWSDFNVNGLNYLSISGITATNASGAYTLANQLTPQEAINIDQKLDDGLPAAGVVTATIWPSTNGLSNSCGILLGDACCAVGGTYKTTTTAFANTPACMLRLRMQ